MERLYLKNFCLLHAVHCQHPEEEGERERLEHLAGLSSQAPAGRHQMRERQGRP